MGLREMRWKNFGKTTEEGHKVFFTGKEDKYENGDGFLVPKDIVNTVTGCRQVSSRDFSIRLRPVPFNIMVIQAYAPTSDYDGSEIEEFYDRMSLIRHRRRTFLLCKETGMQKWARMLVKPGKAFVDPSAITTQMREDSYFWSLPPLTILCWRTPFVITKHPEEVPGIAQMDNTPTRLISA